MERFIPELNRVLSYELLAIWDCASTKKTPDECQEYREKWLREANEPGKPAPPIRTPLAIRECVDIGERLPNQVCGGTNAHCLRFPGVVCSRYGKCHDAQRSYSDPCYSTEPRVRFPAPTTRHLAYHVYPRHGSAWRTRALALRERIELFNGKRLVAIATDRSTEHANMVEDALSGLGIEFIRIANNPERREVASFLPLFERLQDLKGPEHCTLYGQAKGATRIGQDHIQMWARAMEELSLDYWPVVEKLLTQYPLAGSFKKIGRADIDWPNSPSTWHYSGSWFWFRHDQLFTRPNWRKIEEFWSGIESYPSMHFVHQQAGCIFHSDQIERVRLYDSDFWQNTVAPALEKFRKENASRKTKLNPRIGLTLIIPTVGRPTLARTLESLKAQPWQPGDEVILVGDGEQPAARLAWNESGLPGRYLEVPGPNFDWGHTPRNLVMPLANGSHLAALDDDDVWTPDALSTIREAIAAEPDRPHLFQMRRGDDGVLADSPGTPMVVCPNDADKLGKYTARHGGDGDFIRETIGRYEGGAVQHDEVICIVRPKV